MGGREEIWGLPAEISVAVTRTGAIPATPCTAAAGSSTGETC